MLEQQARLVLADLVEARKPLLVFGAAVKDADKARRLMEVLEVPCVTTWAALDKFGDHPLFFGGFGTHGVRYANFAVQNADYILSVGSRLDTKATGSPASGFAPKAKLTMVDIDEAELKKMTRIGRPLYGATHADSAEFLDHLLSWSQEYASLNNGGLPIKPWIEQLRGWRAKYPPGVDLGGLNPYRFIERLSEVLKPSDVIVSDTGCALGWMCHSFKFTGQRFIHAWNNTPMGYGLPAAIGAAFATGGRVVLISGDGGLAVNITELATVERHKLNIKIILFNNRGHAMCRQTQRTWLGGTYPSTSHEGGLACPEYCAVARAYGIPSYTASTLEEATALEGGLTKLLYHDGPAFLNLDIPEDYQIVPQVRFGRNLEDADPLLPREELAEIMA